MGAMRLQALAITIVAASGCSSPDADDVPATIYRMGTGPSMIDVEAEAVTESGNRLADIELDVGGSWRVAYPQALLYEQGTASDPDDLPIEPTGTATNTVAAVPGTGVVVRTGCGEVGRLVVDTFESDHVDVRMRSQRYPLLRATVTFDLNGCACNTPIFLSTSLGQDPSGPCLAAPAGTAVDITASSSFHDVAAITGPGCDGSTTCELVLTEDVTVDILLRVRTPCGACP